MSIERLSRELQPTYASQIDAILSRPLNPENIDGYADDALNDLIDIVGLVETDYRSRPTHEHSTAQAREEAAFAYFDLSDIGSTLDYVADKANEISLLDKLIDGARVMDYVAVPPDKRDMANLGKSNGSYEEKKLIPRLKTLLFILGSELGVDVDNPAELELASGQISSQSMRKASYFLVKAQTLDRSFLVCDEAENISYVFDENELRDLGIEGDDLLKLSKTDLDEFILAKPELGKRLKYTENFVSNMLDAIDDPQTIVKDNGSKAKPEPVVTLQPKTKLPEGYIAQTQLSYQFNSSPAILKRAVAELQEAGIMGDVLTYGSHRVGAKGYSPEQQVLLQEWFDKKYAKPPEGYGSMTTMSQAFGVSDKPIIRVITELTEAGLLGDTGSFSFGGTSAIGYSPDQQNIILNELHTRGLFVEAAPDDYVSMSGLREQTGLTTKPIQRVIDALIEEGLIELPRTFRFSANRVTGFSPEQQAAILGKLEAQGSFISLKPEYLTLHGLYKKYGPAQPVISRAINELIDEGLLSDVETYPLGDNNIPSYSPQQQQLIWERMDAKGLFAPPAPEGFVAVKGFAQQLGCDYEALQKRIDLLRETGQIGQVEKYKFKTTITAGFSPEEQSVITDYLRESDFFTEPAKDDFLSSQGIADKLKVSQNVVQSAIKELVEAELLEIPKPRKFGSQTAPGYSPTEQGTVTYELWHRGVLYDQAPEDYISLSGLVKATGLTHPTIGRVISALEQEGKLGEAETYKFGGKATAGYSPEQRRLIEEQIAINDALAPPAPEGYLNVSGLSRKLGVARKTIRAVIAELATALQDEWQVGTYKFGTIAFNGYSPEQTQLILQRLN